MTEDNEDNYHDAMEGEPETETQEEFERRMRKQEDNEVVERKKEEEEEPVTAANKADQFEKFLKEFKDKEGNFVYFEKIRNLYAKKDKTLYVNYEDLPEELFDFFFDSNEVEENIKAFVSATQEIFREIYGIDVNDRIIDSVTAKISVHNKDMVTPMRDIDIDSLGRLIVFDSTIVSKSETKATLKNLVFICKECRIVQPGKVTKCFNCESKRVKISITLSRPTAIEYIDVQELQEEALSGSSVPIKRSVKLLGDLTEKFNPGDNVRIIGIQKLEKTVSDLQLSKVFEEDEDENFSSNISLDPVIVAHNIELLGNENDSVVENPERMLTEKDRIAILSLRQKYKNDQDLIKVLVNSFAPHIHGYESIKLSVILQAIGSNIIEVAKGIQPKKSQINILLVGDPGVTKSTILEAAKTINYHAIYASGRGASGVGLTAGIDPDAKGMSKLKVGAIVLANNGLCCIDEFSHITPDNKTHLLECMSQGTISINKGGINATLSAKTALLVATNPDAGKYNRYNSLKENVTITDQLISRFDIIFVMPDKVDRDLDAKIFKHIVGQYDRSQKSNQPIEEKEEKIQRIDHDLLFKYILYAKTNNTKGVRFTKGAIKQIESHYHEIRHPEKETDVTATPRQLEGVIRVCIALAKGMLRDTVTEDDAICIINLLNEAYRSAGLITGVSGGMVQTMEYSRPLPQLTKPLAFTLVMQRLTKSNREPVMRKDVITELVDKGKWELADAQKYFDKMDMNNTIYAPFEQNGNKVWLLSDSVYQ